MKYHYIPITSEPPDLFTLSLGTVVGGSGHGLLVWIRQSRKETGHHQVQPTAQHRAAEHVQGDKPRGKISIKKRDTTYVNYVHVFTRVHIYIYVYIYV